MVQYTQAQALLQQMRRDRDDLQSQLEAAVAALNREAVSRSPSPLGGGARPPVPPLRAASAGSASASASEEDASDEGDDEAANEAALSRLAGDPKAAERPHRRSPSGSPSPPRSGRARSRSPSRGASYEVHRLSQSGALLKQEIQQLEAISLGLEAAHNEYTAVQRSLQEEQDSLEELHHGPTTYDGETLPYDSIRRLHFTEEQVVKMILDTLNYGFKKAIKFSGGPKVTSLAALEIVLLDLDLLHLPRQARERYLHSFLPKVDKRRDRQPPPTTPTFPTGKDHGAPGHVRSPPPAYKSPWSAAKGNRFKTPMKTSARVSAVQAVPFADFAAHFVNFPDGSVLPSFCH